MKAVKTSKENSKVRPIMPDEGPSSDQPPASVQRTQVDTED